jgi:hypothetical protein
MFGETFAFSLPFFFLFLLSLTLLSRVGTACHIFAGHSVARLNCGIVVLDTTSAASLDSVVDEYAPYLHGQSVQAQFVLCVGTKRDLESQRQVPSIEVCSHVSAHFCHTLCSCF